MSKTINVTRSSMPGYEEYCEEIKALWDSRWLTNMGAKHRQLEADLKNYLHTPNVTLFANGHLALENVLAAFDFPKGGEVITTPFTFASTTHAIVRSGLQPVFCDVNPVDYTLDVTKIEGLITERTVAILPVHVYGNFCDVDAIAQIAKEHDLKVIYDAAHAFGIRDIEKRGAMSMFSFHPTKLFHSCEGGCLVFRDAALQKPLFNLRNFAIVSETECEAVGSNAKMNELQALMGLKCLERIDDLLAWRHAVAREYAAAFAGSKVRWVGRSANDAYCPVLFETPAMREKVYRELKERCNVFSRRYFYPLLTDFAPYADAKGSCPIAEDAASRVLTLPTYYGLALEDVRAIAWNVLEIVG